jgi:hypothetical protein
MIEDRQDIAAGEGHIAVAGEEEYSPAMLDHRHRRVEEAGRPIGMGLSGRQRV